MWPDRTQPSNLAIDWEWTLKASSIQSNSSKSKVIASCSVGLESLKLSLECTVMNECIFNNCCAALMSSWEYTVSIDCVVSESDGGGSGTIEFRIESLIDAPCAALDGLINCGNRDGANFINLIAAGSVDPSSTDSQRFNAVMLFPNDFNDMMFGKNVFLQNKSIKIHIFTKTLN